VKKLLLGRFLAADELNVVDEQHVEVAVFFTKGAPRRHALADGLHHLVGEFVPFEIEHLHGGIFGAHAVANGAQQMRFSKARAAVDKQGVKRVLRVVGDCAAGCLGELVGAAHNKIFKGVVVLAEGVVGHIGVVDDALGDALSLLLLLFAVYHDLQGKAHELGEKGGQFISITVDDDIFLKVARNLELKAFGIHGKRLRAGKPGVCGGGGVGVAELLVDGVPHVLH